MDRDQPGCEALVGLVPARPRRHDDPRHRDAGRSPRASWRKRRGSSPTSRVFGVGTIPPPNWTTSPRLTVRACRRSGTESRMRAVRCPRAHDGRARGGSAAAASRAGSTAVEAGVLLPVGHQPPQYAERVLEGSRGVHPDPILAVRPASSTSAYILIEVDVSRAPRRIPGPAFRSRRSGTAPRREDRAATRGPGGPAVGLEALHRPEREAAGRRRRRSTRVDRSRAL